MSESEKISILNRDDWDNISNQMITYYWINFKSLKNEIGNKNILYDVLTALHVDNVIAVEGQKNTVFFVNKNNDEDKVPSVPIKNISWVKNNNRQILLELQAKFYGDKSKEENIPQFDSSLAYTTTNGWSNLKGVLTLRIPMFLEPSNYQKPIAIGKLFDKDSNELNNTEKKFPDEDQLRKVSLNILSLYTILDAAFPFGKELFGSVRSKSLNFNKELIFEIDTNSHQEKKKHFDKPFLNLKSNFPNQIHDRGGSSGFDDDFAYLQFVPRMISYIWNHNLFNSTESETNQDNNVLNNQRELLAKLGYQIPIGLKIKIRGFKHYNFSLN